jgi:uncharacterized protein (TIGR03790 family)
MNRETCLCEVKRVLSITLLLLGLPCADAQPISESNTVASAGSEVVVVYNSGMPESRSLAEYYAQKRGVPAGQLIGLELPDREEITRNEFRDLLQKPLHEEFSKRKLWKVTSSVIPATSNQAARVEWKPSQSKIRYAVLCYGVPLKISHDPMLKETGQEKVRPELARTEAAVDSELALLPFLDQHPPATGPLRNAAYTVTNATWLHPTNGILLVARLDGPSATVARGLIDKALLAERDGAWGRAYFDLRSIQDPGYKQGDEWIRGAAEVARHLGLETIVDTNASTFPAGFPLSQAGFYMGWYTENADGPFAQPKVEFMPGAFGYHLHSFSAVTLRSTNRGWVSPLLAKGVTCTMGSVYEPYLAGTPDLTIFAARLVYSGFTFGEAAYACQSLLSWQTTVVGDPLYRPFGRNPDLLHKDLETRKSPLVEWSYLRLVNLNLATGKSASDWVTILENLPALANSAVLTEKLADLYWEMGKPASASFMWQKALERDPSPMQKVRLRLTLADRLGKEKPIEALHHYRMLQTEWPAYPDRADLLRKQIELAKRVDLLDEAKAMQEELDKLTAPTPPPAVKNP